MPDIHPRVMYHKFGTFKEVRQVAQKKRKIGKERRKEVEEEVKKPLEAGFVREIKYTTWLANVIMVKKSSDKWRMGINFTYLNKACPKDGYMLPSINGLVNGASDHNVLSILDAYSGYNQISMYSPYRSKTAFITN